MNKCENTPVIEKMSDVFWNCNAYILVRRMKIKLHAYKTKYIHTIHTNIDTNTKKQTDIDKNTEKR